MALSGTCWIWVLLIVGSSVCQGKTGKSSRSSRSSYDINDLPPVYYPGTSSGGSYKGIYEECSASYDDPDGDCILGTAGRDYPVHSSIYVTGFSCSDFPSPGYYADVTTGCQVFHICSADGRKHSTLCPNGTIFNQEVLVCDWWYNVDCSSSNYFYGVNDYVHEVSKDAARHYSNFPSRVHEYDNGYRQDTYRNAPAYNPPKDSDFSHQNYDDHYTYGHGPSRNPDYTSVHGPARTPDFSHQNYDNHNLNNLNNLNNFNNNKNNYNNNNNNNNKNNYNNNNNNYNYASIQSPARTLDYVTVNSPSAASDYDHNRQQFVNVGTRPEVYDVPRDYNTKVKTVPKYIIKNVGLGDHDIPQYANTPVYKEPYYETSDVQQYDSASYASTIKPLYKKKTTRSNDKSKASKASKGKN